ncbi:MAG: hypothetical protein ACM3XO_08950 [Bacteroidota bacterium]
MPTLNNSTAPAQPTGAHRIILASAFRRERHSTSRQKRAGKILRKMSRFDDYCEVSRDHRSIEIADNSPDE